MRRVDNDDMASRCHPRENLLADLAAAVEPGSPISLLVVFRLGAFNEFLALHGNTAVDELLEAVVTDVTAAVGPQGAFYRSRKDELCGLISGRLDAVESDLFAAAAAVNRTQESRESGVAVGYGTAVLPREASTPIDALILADRRITGFTDGRPLARGSAGGFLPPGKLLAA